MKYNERFKLAISSSIKIVSLIILIGHFCLTFVYVMPLTPVKLENQHLLNMTIGTFFPQNWSLFAPNPVSRNEVMLVKCFDENALPVESVKQLPSEGWSDITTPLWTGLHRNRFTAYDRLARNQSTTIRQYLGAVPELEHWRNSCLKGSETSCQYFEEKVSVLKKDAEARLTKIASSYCKEVSNQTKPATVAIRLRETLPLSWSERYTGSNKVTDFNVGIYPVDENVGIIGIYNFKRR